MNVISSIVFDCNCLSRIGYRLQDHLSENLDVPRESRDAKHPIWGYSIMARQELITINLCTFTQQMWGAMGYSFIVNRRFRQIKDRNIENQNKWWSRLTWYNWPHRRHNGRFNGINQMAPVYTPFNTWFLWTTGVTNPNCVSIGLVAFPQLTCELFNKKAVLSVKLARNPRATRWI